MNASHTNLNPLYEKLAFELDDGTQGHFLSGWQCDNPYAEDFLAAVADRSVRMDRRKYAYFDDDDLLIELITRFHVSRGEPEPEDVLCGCGSSPLLFAFIAYLKRVGIRQVHFVPPLYFTLHTALQLFGINAVPITSKQPFEAGFDLDLPTTHGTILLLSDPVWFAGYPFPEPAMREIANWQRHTSSTVFVDGSLQYLSWDSCQPEHSAILDNAHTVRLLSPSKQLAVHGYRFAYLLMPRSLARGLAWAYANICGPASADSIAFAHEAISAISKSEIPTKLMDLAARRHALLRARQIIDSSILPSCGYFVFEKLVEPLPADYTVMDGRFFDQNNYPGNIKINLLSPSINLILPQDHVEASANE